MNILNPEFHYVPANKTESSGVLARWRKEREKTLAERARAIQLEALRVVRAANPNVREA